MGREIRRVPKGWEHPKDDEGNYQPMYDIVFEEEAREWLEECIEWDKKTINEEPNKKKYPFYWQWQGYPPDRNYYRSEFKDEPICYQIYETVTEGTPVSPVFLTEDEMFKWLVSQRYDPEAARRFIRDGSAPSMAMVGGQIEININTLKSGFLYK
jgi:hypothetical protein